MGCRSDYMEPTPTEHKATNKVNADAKYLADRAVAAADVLREVVLGERALATALAFLNAPFKVELAEIVKRSQDLYVKADTGLLTHATEVVHAYDAVNSALVSGKPITEPVRAAFVVAQTEHRAADLARLMVTFAKSGDTVRLRKVLDANPSKPLLPQLGFDADDF